MRQRLAVPAGLPSTWWLETGEGVKPSASSSSPAALRSGTKCATWSMTSSPGAGRWFSQGFVRAPRPPVPLIFPSLSRQAERPGDHFLHDLVGAAVDALHPRIGVGARDGKFPHEAVAAVELEAFVGYLALELGDP